MRLVSAALLVLALAFCSFGQTTYGIEIGAGGYASSTPHSAGDLTLNIGGNTSNASSYSTIEFRPLSIGNASTTTRTGIKYVVASTGKFELAGLVQGGAATGVAGTAAAFAGGGQVSFWPSATKAPGLYVYATGQALGTANNLGGWEPEVIVGVGFQFNGNSTGSLSVRKKLARMLAAK